MNIEELYKKGLTEAQAEALLKTYGHNELPHQSSFTIIRSFFGQFNNFLTILLLFAAIVSFFLHERLDSYFIFAVVILNAGLGTLQEAKAEKSLNSLKKLTITMSRAVRNGREIIIDSRFLVPGDIVHLEEGTKIPADGELVKHWHLEVNEAALTGESLPVLKSETDAKKTPVYMGTVVTTGRAYIRITKTGSSTRFGTIASKLAVIPEEKTPLMVSVTMLSKQLGFVGIGLCILLFFMTYGRDKNLFESFFFAVSLAVAAVPEGLPTVMTIALSIGVERMAKRGTIVRKLTAIEGIGSITLLATDKTGTLTTGEMRVRKVWFDNKLFDTHDKKNFGGATFNTFITSGIVCSTTHLIERRGEDDDFVGDPTEGAFLLFAKNLGIENENIKKTWNIIDEYAFNSVKKMMTVIATNNKDTYVFSKGAPEEILERCVTIATPAKTEILSAERKTQILDEFRRVASEGFRVIAFSYKKKASEKNAESDHIFLGFICIEDPIRAEVPEAVARAKKAGIKIVMITGDNELTATRVGIETGILEKGQCVLTGTELDNYSDDQLLPLLSDVGICARTTPEHKYRIISLYQKMGEIVAVTGDGVNDVLALKQAQIGVAMGKNGTDVARDTADIVLTDDNFATLVNAIEEGRNIYQHIKNSIVYLLTTNSAEVFAVLLSVLFGFPPILTALQILYMNLITDGPPSLALTFAPNNAQVMNRKALNTKHIIDQQDIVYIVGYGLFGALLSIGSFIVGLTKTGDQQIAQTMAFTTIICIQPFILTDLWVSTKLIISNTRSLIHPAFLLAFITPFLLHIPIVYLLQFKNIFHTVALSPYMLLLALLYATAIIIPTEGRKLTSLFRR